MKYISVKRIFLNIGLLLGLAAIIILGESLIRNSSIISVDAVVVSEEKSDVGYIDSDGNKSNPFSDYTVEYSYNKKEYSRTVLRDSGSLSIGDTTKIDMDKNDPGSYNYNTFESDIIPILALGLNAALLIIVFRSAFRGYYTDYLLRYKKSVIFSIVSGWIPIIWYFTAYLHPAPSELFEGLGEAVILLFLLGAVPVVNIIVWIAAAVSYSRKMKLAESELQK